MKDSDGTQIVVMIQPQGESEASELLGRLRTIVNLDPKDANSELSQIINDEDVKRVIWATCQVQGLDEREDAHQVIADTVEKLLAMRPFAGGRLKAMIMLDDADDEVDAEIDDDADLTGHRADASAALN